MFEDKTLVCKDCGAEFIFSAGEQEFYAEKGFQNEPIRCKACRNARKSQRNGEKEMYDAVCAQCGAPTKIPFVPKNDRPIYCSACFQARRANHRIFAGNTKSGFFTARTSAAFIATCTPASIA